MITSMFLSRNKKNDLTENDLTENIFSYFSEKRGIDISSKLSLKEAI